GFIAKGFDRGHAQIGSQFVQFGVEVSNRSIPPMTWPCITCHTATHSLRATATAALLRPRRRAIARPHFCNGLLIWRSFLADWISRARIAPRPWRLSAVAPSHSPLWHTLGLSPR